MTDERRNRRSNYPGSAQDMRFNRSSLYLAAACLSAIVWIEPAFSDESLAYVLKGFAAQEHAPRQRTEFLYLRENVRNQLRDRTYSARSPARDRYRTNRFAV